MARKEAKRGRGRPRKQKYFSAAELREKATANIRRTQESQLGRADLDIEQFIQKGFAITGKHKFTRKEMDEFRLTLQMLYTEFVTDKHEQEAEQMQPFTETLRTFALEEGVKPVAGQMTWEQWCKEHALRPNGKRKPGPPKKKPKAIWDLTPGDKGTSDAPSIPVDIDAFEEQLLAERYDEHAEEMKMRPQNKIGKRFRDDSVKPRMQQPRENFWV